MNSDESAPLRPASPVASLRVSISPYVNEQFPNWEEMLSAHDVARLTRRPRWMVLSLTLLGRFPRKHRFHGRSIGWLRSDVLSWLARDLSILRCHAFPTVRARSNNARQGFLPLSFARRPYTARRRVGNCMDLRNRSRRLRVRRACAPELRET